MMLMLMTALEIFLNSMRMAIALRVAFIVVVKAMASAKFKCPVALYVGDSGSNDCSCSDDNFGCNNVGDERDVGVDINNQEDDGCDYVCALAAPNDTVSGRDDNGDSGGNSGDNDVCCGDTSGTDYGYKGNSLVSYICFSGICFYTCYILPI